MHQKDLENRFKNHELKVICENPDVTILQFSQPHEWNGRMEIIFTHQFNTVVVLGDYGEAVYRWGGNNSGINFFLDLDHSYFMGKCVSWSKDGDMKTVDSEEVLTAVLDLLVAGDDDLDKSWKDNKAKYDFVVKNLDEDEKEEFLEWENFENLFCECDTMNEVYNVVNTIDSLRSLFDDYGVYVPDVSKYCWRTYAHHYAVKEVAKLFVDKREEAKDA
jgi:hypothetical protein